MFVTHSLCIFVPTLLIHAMDLSVVSLILQVNTNGVITLGEPAVECCPVRFEDIQFGAAAFVTPYWIDNDPSSQGNVSYSVFVRGSEQLQKVSSFISQSQRTSFIGTWMLVAYWLDVPEALLERQVSHCSVMNTKQLTFNALCDVPTSPSTS